MPCNNASGFEDTTLPPAEEATTPEVPKMEVTETEISNGLMESNESDEKLELPSGFEDIDADLIADEDKGIDSKDTPVKAENVVDKEGVKLDLPSSSSEVDNSKSAIPDYIPSNVVEESDTSISKFQKEIISKQEQPVSIEKISPEELKEKNNLEEFTKVAAADLEKEQLEFVNNESQLLILPNDDVVEGELTEEVKFDLMDFREYVKVFWSKYHWIKNEDKRESIEDFINSVSEDEYVYSEEELVLALSEATKSIERNNIYSLVFLLDAYPILQRIGEGGNTLLHESVYKDNYLSARLLLSKGIDMSVKNSYNHTALELAEKMGNKNIIFLLKSSKL
ncbi:MAG: ankyrin repeat domain-containing protein [Rickettsiaceae bacterium]|nr:ankyrin repeat domain-containing protein [Rickettsiaceae bacterium]